MIFLDPEAADELWWIFLEYYAPSSLLDEDRLDRVEILAGIEL